MAGVGARLAHQFWNTVDGAVPHRVGCPPPVGPWRSVCNAEHHLDGCCFVCGDGLDVLWKNGTKPNFPYEDLWAMYGLDITENTTLRPDAEMQPAEERVDEDEMQQEEEAAGYATPPGNRLRETETETPEK